MKTNRFIVTFTDEQQAKVDEARGRESRASFIREAVRFYMAEKFGVDLGDDAPVGGPRCRTSRSRRPGPRAAPVPPQTSEE